jgi:O-antigen ligase
MRADALALSPERRHEAAFGAVLLMTLAVAGWFVHPLVGLVLAVAAVLMIALDWRVSSPSLLAAFAVLVMIVPADIRLGIPLPMDATADRLALAMLFGAWSLGMLHIRPQEPSKAGRHVAFALKGILVVAFVSLLVNAPQTVGNGVLLSEAKEYLLLLAFAGTYFLTLAIVSGRADVERMCRVFVLGGAIAGASAVVERFTRSNPIRTALLSVPVFKPTRTAQALIRGADLRVAGTGEHAIAFGGAMAMLLPVALYFTVTSSGRKRLWWGLATALIATAMLFSVSRSALIAGAVVLVVLLLVWPRTRTALIVGAAAGLFATHMFVPGLLGTFRATLQPDYVVQQESDPNSSVRFTDYPKVAAMVPNQPLFGLGYAGFDPHRYFYLDNQVLKFVLELGVAGWSFIVLFFVTAAAMMTRAVRAGPGETTLEGALLASIIAFAVLSVFFDTFGFAQVTYLFFMLSALGVRAAETRLRPGRGEALAA